MSWHFSRALEAAFLEGNCSGGKQLPPWSSIPSAADDSCSGKMKDTFHHSPFGTMYVPSTESRGAELLTWFLVGFPVKTSVPRDLAQESMASEADSGRKWQGSFAKWTQTQSKWKTAQCSLLGDSDEYSETWPRWGSMRNGESFLRPIPALRTSESASGLWQTPVADDACNRKSGKWNSRGEPKLSAQVLIRTSDNLETMMPAGGQLNPDWVEWLMGWPIGWTDCEPLATDKFHAWLQQHGKS